MHTQYPRTAPGQCNVQIVEPSPAFQAVPDFHKLSFEDAVRLFKEWGFQVEPGPRPEEVTLILEKPGFRTYSVHDAHILTEMAAVALRARWRNGRLVRQEGQRGQGQRAANREYVELMC